MVPVRLRTVSVLPGRPVIASDVVVGTPTMMLAISPSRFIVMGISGLVREVESRVLDRDDVAEVSRVLVLRLTIAGVKEVVPRR